MKTKKYKTSYFLSLQNTLDKPLDNEPIGEEAGRYRRALGSEGWVTLRRAAAHTRLTATRPSGWGWGAPWKCPPPPSQTEVAGTIYLDRNFAATPPREGGILFGSRQL